MGITIELDDQKAPASLMCVQAALLSADPGKCCAFPKMVLEVTHIAMSTLSSKLHKFPVRSIIEQSSVALARVRRNLAGIFVRLSSPS